MNNGSYHYYRKPGGPRILVEVWGGAVAEVGEEGWRDLRNYPGVFVALVEVRDTPPASVPGATCDAVARKEVQP